MRFAFQHYLNGISLRKKLMASPLRLEFAGALYHVTSRGDRREDIFEDDQDREVFLTILEDLYRDHNWIVYAYCLMSDHYHLLA